MQILLQSLFHIASSSIFIFQRLIRTRRSILDDVSRITRKTGTKSSSLPDLQGNNWNTVSNEIAISLGERLAASMHREALERLQTLRSIASWENNANTAPTTVIRSHITYSNPHHSLQDPRWRPEQSLSDVEQLIYKNGVVTDKMADETFTIQVP
jgi:hypothetical protein